MSTNAPMIEEATTSAEVGALDAKFRDRFGRPQVLRILKCFATHPPLLKHLIGFDYAGHLQPSEVSGIRAEGWSGLQIGHGSARSGPRLPGPS